MVLTQSYLAEGWHIKVSGDIWQVVRAWRGVWFGDMPYFNGPIRGSSLSDASLKDELLRLRREIDTLNGELAGAKSRAVPEGTAELAHGDEETTLLVDLGVYSNRKDVSGQVTFSVRWDDIFRAILPQTLGGGADPQGVASALASLAQQAAIKRRDDAAEHDG